ncbi:MAP10-like protein [Mya arenaria]|uniref:MAP10-like protein n=1 Tax=Mya arenaria TaxID=6604 RepID=A0ABY7FBQ7_MYAAR|nr:microtubule-associated protein 10-like [Mya arenaria]WAR19588.1 MAP10-like protein [Mya arenaria]
MGTGQESLFSLELVVEKLYLPYVTCRYPAVAFRLLDFPTILISHVEKDLADGIKQKISIDPYYRVPNQFAELQDKNGNFIVKKGKSCLFKISVDTLAMHLTNTPLYIMVIDEYPEVPKLLGNSSLALSELDSIKHDIKTNGHTVPSVHGDKGLFKIYSLMGKEIGYMIMGFRLLSLGPGLISHLPNSAFVKRASEVPKQKSRQQHSKQQQSVVEEVIEIKQQQATQAAPPVRKPFDLNSTRDVAAMTEMDKCDALMQTDNFEQDNIDVAEKAEKILKSIETQTERRRKAPQKAPDFMIAKDESESDDEIILNPNMVRPPPLFYNSEAQPTVNIERDINAYLGYSSAFDDATLEDLSEDEHLDKQNLNRLDDRKVKESPLSQIHKEEVRVQDAKTIVISNIKGANKTEQSNQQVPAFNLGAFSASEPAFPLLTALLTELSKIQNPQFVNQAMQQVSQAQTSVAAPAKAGSIQKSKSEEIVRDATELEESAAPLSQKKRSRKSNRSVQQTEGVPKGKGWLRKAPEAGVKKTKLVFGLTNTQRLRLAKQNPNWLESAEKDEKAIKLQRQKERQKQKEPEPELETGNLSDTYTEVRRLAAKELEKETLGKSQLMAEVSRTKKLKKRSSRESSPAKTRSKSPKLKKNKQLKETVQVREDSDVDSHERNTAHGASKTEPSDAGKERLDSAADSVPSSRIEVHIPSARVYESDDHDNTFSDSFEEESITDKRDTGSSRFPGFNKGDDTLPDSIKPDGATSQNTTIDTDSPLESTRMSKQFKQAATTGESLFKSMEYNTNTNQFQSTDEPELQQLMSEGEKSGTLPTPSTDRSFAAKSPVTGGYTPSLTQGTTQTRLSMKFEVLNPQASQQSPLPSMRRSQQFKVDSINARPTPTGTPRSRSSQGSPKNPSPRPRKNLRERKIEFKKESIHTESVSSYMPSESENILSLISDGSYSDDFHMSSEKDESSKVSLPEFQRFIPNSKLGFTIN